MRRQRETRWVERTVRKGAVAYARSLAHRDVTLQCAAEHLGIQPARLQAWRRQWRAHKLDAKARGRPPQRSDRETRQAILQALHDLGPQTGMPTLQGLFPRVPKRELDNLLWRFREHYRLLHSPLAHELVWTRVGAVWAMDYTDPPNPIDDTYRDIFVNRDLASGEQIDALPVDIETGQNTADALEARFVQYGAPLVIKQDNGGTVTAGPVQRLLDKWSVHMLRSPVKKPQYNGSCEAGNGSIKARARHVAARNGRHGHWTCDDIEEARILTNQTARPKGPAGPTPEEAWSTRQPITETERKAFDNDVRLSLNEARAHRQKIRLTTGDPKAGDKDATLERDAVRHALVAGGYLRYRRS